MDEQEKFRRDVARARARLATLHDDPDYAGDFPIDYAEWIQTRAFRRLEDCDRRLERACASAAIAPAHKHARRMIVVDRTQAAYDRARYNVRVLRSARADVPTCD